MCGYERIASMCVVYLFVRYDVFSIENHTMVLVVVVTEVRIDNFLLGTYYIEPLK